MEKFDLAEFNLNKNIQGNLDQYQFTENDSLVTLTEKSKFYLEEKKALNDSLLIDRKAYSKETLNLIWSGKIIYNAAEPILIGISRNYDSDGNLINEIDHDRNLTYPITDLIEKVKVEYNLKIDSNIKTYYIERNYIDKLYYVCYKKKDNYGYNIPFRLVFDGITGEFIREEKISLKY